MPPLAFSDETFPGRAIFDAAVSHALLRRVARGEIPEILRLYVPEDVVAFSILDARKEGFPEALECAREAGCQSVLRLGGGHAALFHPLCLAFSWAMPDPLPRDGIRERFAMLSQIVERSLRHVGVNARVGEVPGEYCPGEYSVSAEGRIKLMGVAQRIIQGAAHLGGVIVVGNSGRLREVLSPIYRALGHDFDAATAGAVEDARPGIELGTVRHALLREWAAERELTEVSFDAPTTDLAEKLKGWHDPENSSRPAASGLPIQAAKTLAVPPNGGD